MIDNKISYYCISGVRNCRGTQSPRSSTPPPGGPAAGAVADRYINHCARGIGAGHVAARSSAADRPHVPSRTRHMVLDRGHDNPDVIISNGPVHV